MVRRTFDCFSCLFLLKYKLERGQEEEEEKSHLFIHLFPYPNYLIGTNNTHNNGNNDSLRAANISEIKMMISRYNDAQMVLNEDLYGPLQNNSVIIVVQVSVFIEFIYIKLTSVDFCQSSSYFYEQKFSTNFKAWNNNIEYL